MIRDGRVAVDGSPASIGQQVDPESAEVRIDGKLIPVAPGLVYYLLYKPVGTVKYRGRHPRPPKPWSISLNLTPGSFRWGVSTLIPKGCCC